jgi:hypothetical protein
MPRTPFVLLLAVAMSLLALALPEPALARPPEVVSGKMVFDEVAEGLRKYRKETDEDKKLTVLKKLVQTHDPRVAIVLGEMLSCSNKGTRFYAAYLICRNFNQDVEIVNVGVETLIAQDWWKANGTDLRRRAKQLPQ